MADDFDPYLQWLGIRDPKRPPDHYRLLGLEVFEEDLEAIGNAADRQMAHVRSFQAGKHSSESQRLLNELAKAKVCLLNPQKKAEYDALLRGPAAAVQTNAAKPAAAAATARAQAAGTDAADGGLWWPMLLLAAVVVLLAGLIVVVW